MNKLEKLLNTKNKNLLSVYFTAGYPHLNSAVEIIKELENNQVDLIEIGIPFSDPVADGPIIQYSNSVALENGMTLKLLFKQLHLLNGNSKIPKILMGYFNPVFRFGVEEFCKACKLSGIDGVIIPDLPLNEYETHYRKIFEEYGIHFIFLVSPQTSNERLKQIDHLSTAFVYAVSTNATTGGTADLNLQSEYFIRLKKHLKHPFLIGFGVRDNQSFQTACHYANGAIVGSAFIQSISQKESLAIRIEHFINDLRLNQHDYTIRG